MLEASDLQAVENVSLFWRALVDLCFINKEAQKTKAYTKYVDVINLFFQTFCSPRWTKATLKEL